MPNAIGEDVEKGEASMIGQTTFGFLAKHAHRHNICDRHRTLIIKVKSRVLTWGDLAL